MPVGAPILASVLAPLPPVAPLLAQAGAAPASRRALTNLDIVQMAFVLVLILALSLLALWVAMWVMRSGVRAQARRDRALAKGAPSLDAWTEAARRLPDPEPDADDADPGDADRDPFDRDEWDPGDTRA